MTTEASESSLAIVRKLKASPRAVWRALTQPEALQRWMGPSDDFQVLTAEADVRVGGHYRIVMNSPDGAEQAVGGVYREVEADRKLVYTWAWQSTPERESLVTVELTPAGDGTELLLKHEGFADKESRDRHQQGWSRCVRRLVRMLG